MVSRDFTSMAFFFFFFLVMHFLSEKGWEEILSLFTRVCVRVRAFFTLFSRFISLISEDENMFVRYKLSHEKGEHWSVWRSQRDPPCLFFTGEEGLRLWLNVHSFLMTRFHFSLNRDPRIVCNAWKKKILPFFLRRYYTRALLHNASECDGRIY